jgi:hypothetical protein
MTANPESIIPVSPARRRARQFRIAAAVVLLAGIIGAGLVYCLETPPEDLPDDIANTTNSKRVQRDIEVNFGKMGLFTTDLMDALRDPGTQALVILVTAGVIAGGCFYIARLMDFDAEDRADEKNLPRP